MKGNRERHLAIELAILLGAVPVEEPAVALIDPYPWPASLEEVRLDRR